MKKPPKKKFEAEKPAKAAAGGNSNAAANKSAAPISAASALSAPAQPNLFEIKSVRPVADEMASTAFFSEMLPLPFHKVDESFLRRLGHAENLNPRTGKPWIPAPVKAKWPILATVAGIAEWIDTNADSVKRLPRICDSMKHAEQLYHVPVEQMEFVRNHGGADAFVGSSRVDVIKILEHCELRHKKIYSGGAANISGLEDMPELDKDIMMARVLMQTEIEKIRENSLAEKALRTADDFEDEVADPLATLAAGLNNYEKQTGGKIKSLLFSLGISETDAARVVALAVTGINDPRQKLLLAIQNAEKMSGKMIHEDN